MATATINKDTIELLGRIDKALERMKNEGNHLNEYNLPCEHYERLQAKRNAIAQGQPYTTRNLSPFLIAFVGSHIPDVNMGMNNNTIKGRGDKTTATIEAVNSYYRFIK